MTTLRLILGDQLNPRHSWFSRVDDHVVYLLLELRQETDYVRHHAQKLLAVLAAMRHFAARLKAAGHRVRYVALDHPSNRGTLEANLDALLQHYAASHFSWQWPDEWRLDQQLQAWAARQTVVCQAVDSEHFLAPRLAASQLFAGKASWRMETFYRHMRKQYGVLLDERGGPVGGKWNFDQDNRKPWRGSPHRWPMHAPATITARCGRCCRMPAWRRWVSPVPHNCAGRCTARRPWPCCSISSSMACPASATIRTPCTAHSRGCFIPCCPSPSTPRCCRRGK
ncbi:cryptochrome/photolyase family protein [Aquitalea magnusonii]|uniref:cryptochrome/photolyase family protein n=1 Tax=Aquitalea magnusonii TaxID=332411 RepID=UPI000ABC4391|nr:cryptochrome/photolyase family protein [Aquitalea magnusonii]